ncbi:MAG: hypothetical protein ACR2O2_00040 [Ruegeria sp.]
MGNRLMILFGALFVVFGVLLGITEDPAFKNIWGGLSAGSLGAFALSMAADALKTGKIRIQFDVIDRRTRPRLYWAAIGLVACAGCGVVASAIWLVVFKSV